MCGYVLMFGNVNPPSSAGGGLRSLNKKPSPEGEGFLAKVEILPLIQIY